MAAQLMKYEEIEEWSHEEVQRAIAADAPEALLRAVVAVSMCDKDWRYAQDLCVRLASHRHYNVRGNAVLGFGHIARVHGKLEKELVLPIIVHALKDEEEYVRGQAHGAKDDTEHFLKWKYEA